ncbi:hypothetical protein [Sulfurospirillum sp. MES]|uniref:hypothetical protein n=1 Tax=Sulfurospirillum sp. MES TaxID=1565314 RepID=UPI00057DBEED|nr:hypothetical protein [Sulfurospirillum sp. MES]
MNKMINIILLFIFIVASSLQAKDERVYCAMLFTSVSTMSFQNNDIETGKFYESKYKIILNKVKKNYSDNALMKLMHDEMDNVLVLLKSEDSDKIAQALTECMKY